MENLFNKISGNASLMSSVMNCEKEITPVLQNFLTNFPEYTDHSINHSKRVLSYISYLLGSEIEKLNEDEAYILIMSAFLHDIGMCPSKEMVTEIIGSPSFIEKGQVFEEYLRDTHHLISYEYITSEWKELKILNETYAEAIGLVSMGHRKVQLLDFDSFKPDFVVKTGSDFVCIPYLAAILRLADELDLTNDRTPDLLYNKYFPSDKISKEEWEKHKANYFISFNSPTIRITSKCSNKDLYFALLKQSNKIDNVLKYVQKIVNTIPHYDRRLKFDYFKLEKDIKTLGFIPKEIGFTFDLQNTIDTFIGDNIYHSKYVAIRECLQNAIDTCRYKVQLIGSAYTPEIIITLIDKKLVISDNGLGMDEFIVENYFSKLAKSYYTESKVAKEFEAISQFGIGVFSYFLICEYFEVETKQEGKAPLKFGVTKNAENYFHFYDDYDLTIPGTSITFFLRDEIAFDDLIDQIRYYVRFYEFPISVNYEDRIEFIVSNSFALDRFELLGKRIERDYLEILNKLEIIDAPINNDTFQGNLGMLFSKDESGILLPIHSYDTLNTYRTSNIELSQKGIYLGSLDHHDFNNIIGKIDLKRKNDIDIGRYNLKSSNQLSSIIQVFVEQIFEKVFDNWKIKTPKEKSVLTTDLIRLYIGDFTYNNVTISDKFHDRLFCPVFTGSRIEYLPISEIIKWKEFYIIHEDTPFSRRQLYDYGNIDDIYSELNKPLVLQNRGKVAYFILDIFKDKKYHIEIRTSKKHWFFFIRTNQVSTSDYKFLNYRYEKYSFDKPHICAYTNFALERIFNTDHEIISYFINNASEITKSQRKYKLFEEFFKEIGHFMYKIHSSTSELKNPTSEILLLNALLNKLNDATGEHFVLSNKDFPIWINEKIDWTNI